MDRDIMKTSAHRLSMFDIIMMVISLVIGMGIFRAPVTVAQRAGSETLFYAAWLTGGFIALCGALGFAEIGRRLPVTGAYYRMFAVSYSKPFAFAINSLILITNAASSGGVALLGAEYLAPLLPAAIPVQLIATALIFLLFVLNLSGLRASATAQNILMGIKLLMLLAVISSLFIVDPAQPAANAQIFTPKSGFFEAFGLALIAVSFTYGGYQSTINFGGDTHNDGVFIPRGIIAGVIIITILYLFANMAYVHVIGFENLAGAQSIASVVVSRLFGSTAGIIMSITMIISVFGYINVSMLTNPRVLHAMSMDGVLPTRIAGGQADAKGVNIIALLSFTLLSIFCVYAGKSFETILNYTIFIDSIGLAAGMYTLFKLRGRPLSSIHAIAAAIFILSCLYTSANIFMFDTQAGIYGSILFTAIMGAGYLFLRNKS
jgi:APA family basic amino acid/polyamine antiporter